MAPSSAQLTAVLTLAAVFGQIACQSGSADGGGADTSDDGASGGAASGGVPGVGGALLGTGGGGTGGGDTGGGDTGGTDTGGLHSTGGTGGVGSGGVDASGGVGGTAPCPEYPHSPCGEGGCQLGDSYPGGTGALGENGDYCLYVVTAGPTGDCNSGDEMGPCDHQCFCQYGTWLCWQPDCP